MAEQNNPIAQRLAQLQQLYADFSEDDEARVLAWRIEHDEAAMIEEFFDAETEDDASSPDLFLIFEKPFLSKKDYGRALYEELCDDVSEYINSGTALTEIVWQPNPQLQKQSLGAPDFFKELQRFAQSLPEMEEDKLTAYLAPQEVRDFEEWAEWLQMALEAGLPPVLRIMVTDYAAQPWFAPLAAAFPGQVRVIEPRLDMTQAMKEVAASAGDNSPGTQFQQHFIDLSAAAGRGDLPAMESAYQKAASIAMQEGWKILQVAVCSVAGMAYMRTEDNPRALQEFRQAEQIAREALSQKEPEAGRHIANALFAQGAIHVKSEAHPEAAAVYREAAAVLEAAQEQFLRLEAWRMAGFCHERLNEPEAALESYRNAFEAGAQLDEESRTYSTLPYAAEALIRLLNARFAQSEAAAVEVQMQEAYGANWRSLVPSTVTPP